MIEGLREARASMSNRQSSIPGQEFGESPDSVNPGASLLTADGVTQE
jgi:hypothetical protein